MSLHVGIILDGNRRYAKKKGIKPWKGHEEGAKNVKKLINDWVPTLGIKELTLYTFSIQNFNRTKIEIDFLMSLFVKFFSQLEKEVDQKNIKINFIGRLHLFSKEIQKMALQISKKTENNDGLIVNFAFGYGGREEIIDGIKKFITESKNINNLDNLNIQSFTKHLYLQSEPDLIIRTGGDFRTSNFLVWQSTYAEWFFQSKLWPEFNKEDLVNILQDFSKRERRFGR